MVTKLGLSVLEIISVRPISTGYSCSVGQWSFTTWGSLQDKEAIKRGEVEGEVHNLQELHKDKLVLGKGVQTSLNNGGLFVVWSTRMALQGEGAGWSSRWGKPHNLASREKSRGKWAIMGFTKIKRLCIQRRKKIQYKTHHERVRPAHRVQVQQSFAGNREVEPRVHGTWFATGIAGCLYESHSFDTYIHIYIYLVIKIGIIWEGAIPTHYWQSSSLIGWSISGELTRWKNLKIWISTHLGLVLTSKIYILESDWSKCFLSFPHQLGCKFDFDSVLFFIGLWRRDF